MRAVDWVQRLDDGMNPVVVKELRQALRSRVAMGLAAAFLVAHLVVFTGSVMMWQPHRTDVGREVFMVYSYVLAVTLVIAVPAYAGGRCFAEHLADEFKAMLMPGLSFDRIFWGKTLSTLVIDLMLLSIMAPFAYACTLMRGIDLPTIGLVLAVNAVFSWVGVLSLLSVACMIRTIPGGIGWGLFSLFGAGMTVMIVVGLNVALIREGAMLAVPEALFVIIGLGLVYAPVLLLLYFRAKMMQVGAVYRYRPPTGPDYVIPEKYASAVVSADPHTDASS